MKQTIKKITIKKDNKLNQLIYKIFINSRKNYGTRRIKAKLLSLYGLIVSRRLISTSMKDLSLFVETKKKYKINTTNSNYNLPIANNIINRDFISTKLNEKYVYTSQP